jgi:transcriptional regulator GlxA family with amidase domain
MKTKTKIKTSKLPRRVLFVAVPPIAELDLTGALSVFQDANFTAQVEHKTQPYKIEIVTAGDDLIVAGECGLTMLAEKHLTDVTGTIDTVLVVAGTQSFKISPNDLITVWLQQNFAQIRRVASVCVGAFALAAAGLLDNRRATTHWRACGELKNKHPQIIVEQTPIFVRDGNIYTSAGVTAGMDLALQLVEEDLGSRVALETARNLVMFLRRPGGQAQFSAALQAQTPERQSLKDLQAWIADNLREPLEIRQLARQAAMSERNFARVFAREFGTTPARYVAAQRLEAARRELEQTEKGQAEIAARCGFGTAGNLRRVFAREVGTTPEQYRTRFRQTVASD